MARLFRFGGPIGSGGFGLVDAAVRIDEDGREIEGNLARKTLLPHHAAFPQILKRFKREVRFLGEMEHPHVIPVVGRNLSDDPPWFVMPRAECNLLQVIPEHVDDRDWIVEIFTGILEGVAHAHGEHNVIHRDLKPENVLIVDGVPKVSDFGLGKRLDSDETRLTVTDAAMGTKRYMAPEQHLDAAHVGPAADVYALGMILGDMLTDPPPDSDRLLREAIPDDFRSFIDRCTQDKPNDRYANAADALAAFQLLISGGGATGDVSGDLDGQIKAWENPSTGFGAEELAAIAETLLSRRDDEEFYFRAMPRLPGDLTTEMLEERPEDFDAILEAYNGHIQGGLPFEYCDVVANFYRHIFLESEVLAHRQLVFERLFELGPSHNRWHVGDVVAELLAWLQDEATIELVVRIVRRQPANARWFKPYVDEVDVDPRIRDAFDDASG